MGLKRTSLQLLNVKFALLGWRTLRFSPFSPGQHTQIWSPKLFSYFTSMVDLAVQYAFNFLKIFANYQNNLKLARFGDLPSKHCFTSFSNWLMSLQQTEFSPHLTLTRSHRFWTASHAAHSGDSGLRPEILDHQEDLWVAGGQAASDEHRLPPKTFAAGWSAPWPPAKQQNPSF